MKRSIHGIRKRLKIRPFTLLNIQVPRVHRLTAVALGILLVAFPIAWWTFTQSTKVKAAAISITTGANSIQVDVSNRYRAVFATNQTTDYLLISDRAQSDSSPNNTYEVMGPYIREASTQYTLRRDSARVTTLLEVSDVRVRVRITGALMDEGGSSYLTDGTNNILVTEEYTFTTEGFAVSTTTNFRTSGVALDSSAAEDGYNWMMIDGDIQDTAFTGTLAYGDGTTEATTAVDATFEDTNVYAAFLATDGSGYQSALVIIPRDGWFSHLAATGTDDWNLDIGNSGTNDRLHTRERGTTPTSIKNSQWYFLFVDENSADTEAEREAYVNSLRNPDLLIPSIGGAWDEEPPYRTTNLFSNEFEIGEENLCDDAAGWIEACGGTGTQLLGVAPGYTGRFGGRAIASADSAQAVIGNDTWTAVRSANARVMFKATELGLSDTSDYAEIFSLSDGDYANVCRTWVDNNATFGQYRFVMETVRSGGSDVDVTSVQVVPGTWYSLELYGQAESTTGANNGACVLYVNGTQVASRTSVNFGSGAGQTIIEAVNVGISYMFNPSGTEVSVFDYDNVVVDSHYIGPVGGNTDQNMYTLAAHSSNGLNVDIDGGTYTRFRPNFYVRNYMSSSLPASLKVESITQTQDNQYNAGYKPFADADLYNNTGTTYTQLASGGNTSSANEYLNDSSDNFTLTFDEATDYLYLGLDTAFTGVISQLANVGVGTAVIEWEYCSVNTDTATDCDTWASLPVVESVTGAKNFTISGAFSFSEPADWIQAQVNSGPSLYYIRAVRSSGTFSTQPIEKTLRPDIVIVQYLGDISSNDQTLEFVLDDGDVTSHWSFDEGVDNTCSGGTNDACDTTRNGNDMSRSGALWQTEDMCVAGKCVYFDGVNDSFTRSDDNDLDSAAGGSFTISGWFRHAPKTTGTDVLVAKYNSGTGTDGGYKLQMESDGDITVGIDDDNSSFPEDSVTSTAATYDDNQWHHVAAVKNGNTSLRLYIDGVEVGTADVSISATGTLGNTDAFFVGIDGDGSSNPYGGFLDEVKIYPTARSASEVLADVHKGAASRGSPLVAGVQDPGFLNDGLVGYWKLDESSSTAADSSGNGLTLTNNGTTTYVGAKFGNGSEHVPASSQYLSTATTINGIKTVSFWVNPDSTTNHFINLTSVAYINVSSGTIAATGWTNPTIYVNGSVGTTLTQDVWQLVTVTSETGINADTWNVGRANGSFFDGTMDEVRAYSRTLPSAEVKSLYAWAPRPVGLWLMDENTGTTVYDRSGNTTNSTTWTGNTTWAAGRYGSALSFDGTDDVVRFTETSSVDIGLATTSISVGAWVKTSTNYVGNATILAKDDGSGAYPWHLYLNSSEFACFQISDGSASPSVCGSTAINDGNWHYIAGVRDVFTDVLRVYVDGVFINSTADSTTTTSSNNDELSIGGSGNATYTLNDWNGLIDLVSVYWYARTPQQIGEDMNGGHPAGGSPIGSQTLYWGFDEGQSTTANSRVAIGLSGSLTNMSSPATSTSGWTPNGKIGKGIVFDGSDDAVVLATASDGSVDFNTSESFSLSAWVYSTTMAGSSDMDAIIVKWDATSSQRAYRLVLTNDDADTTGNFRAEIFDESTDQTISAASATDSVSENTWYHVVLTFNGGTSGTAGDLKLYVDGLPRAENSGASFGGLEDQGSDFTVGDYDTNDATGANTAFVGRIDEVKVYNDVLTAEQVKIDMNVTAGVNYGTGTQESAALTDGAPTAPIMEWKLDENTGSSALDTSGNENIGTIANALYQSAKYGSGLTFDGTGDLVSRADDADLDFTASDSFTIETWFRHDTASAQQMIVAKHGTAGTDGGYKITMESDGDLSCGIDDDDTFNDAAATSTLATYDDNQWHHVACVKNANSTLSLYIDGIFITSTSIGSIGTLENTDTFYYGMDGNGSSNGWIGSLDHLIVTRAVKTQSQIQLSVNRGAAVLNWKFDDCVGGTAQDSSMNNDGTLTIGASGTYTVSGDCTVSSASSTWYNGASGKFGRSIGFDGTDDYVANTDLAFSFASNLTMSFWFKANSAPGVSQRRMVELSVGAANGLQAVMTSTGLVGIDNAGGPTSTVLSSTSKADSAWHHMMITRVGTTYTIYVDGVSIGTSGGTAPTYTRLYAGASVSLTGFFPGFIDDIQIFNYALSTTQMKYVMNGTSAVRYGQ